MTIVFKDAATLPALVPVVMAYPHMDEVKAMKELVDEVSNNYSIHDDDKATLVEINEKRGRAATYDNAPVKLEDFTAEICMKC